MTHNYDNDVIRPDVFVSYIVINFVGEVVHSVVVPVMFDH
jgi:hypothetical protein